MTLPPSANAHATITHFDRSHTRVLHTVDVNSVQASSHSLRLHLNFGADACARVESSRPVTHMQPSAFAAITWGVGQVHHTGVKARALDLLGKSLEMTHCLSCPKCTIVNGVRMRHCFEKLL
jgi:hypothetical protein